MSNQPKLKGVCLLVTDIDAPSGGVQKNSRLLLSELHERGIATYACVRNYHGLPTSDLIDGTIVHRSRVIGRRTAINGILYFLETGLWLVRNRARYDVIQCQQMFGPTMVAAAVGPLLGKPVLTRVTLSGDRGELTDLRRLPFYGLRSRLLKRVDRWVALSREMKQELMRFGVPGERIRIIYNSTDLPPEPAYAEGIQAKMRRKLGLGGAKTGVFAGRLAEEKNLDVLIRAWADVRREFPDAQLLLLGEGGAYRNVEAKLKELVGDLKLTRSVHFLGHVARPKDYILASDVFLLPSSAEGMSNALVEAFACGAAIVATDIPANAELCEDRSNALLVPVGDASALAQAIKEIFRSQALARELGIAARRKAEAELPVEKMVSAYVETYGDMLERRT